jgi:hypothetical protein
MALRNRIRTMLSLPMEELDRLAMKQALDRIGRERTE